MFLPETTNNIDLSKYASPFAAAGSGAISQQHDMGRVTAGMFDHLDWNNTPEEDSPEWVEHVRHCAESDEHTHVIQGENEDENALNLIENLVNHGENFTWAYHEEIGYIIHTV
jgi:hypothetical protein